jgi:hypothetical protein
VSEISFRKQTIGVGFLAAGTLLLESTLTRLLAVAQFYHFAFLVVSLALLGFGASGSILTILPGFSEGGDNEQARNETKIRGWMRWSGVGFATSVAFAYGVVNWLPFDSYSIAWDRRQVLYFVLYYFGLTLPFLFSGLGIGALLTLQRERSHLVYAANLLGSGLGALVAPVVLGLSGVPGAVVISALMGVLAGTGFEAKTSGDRIIIGLIPTGLIIFFWLTALNLSNQAPLGMSISPYKGLASALRYPGSRRIFGRWNAISRIDVIADAGTRQLPGLSYTIKANPPPQHGLSIDAEALEPINLVSPENFKAGYFLPEALAFRVRENGEVLVLNPGGGLGVLQALAGGAESVTAVMDNPLIIEAISDSTTEQDLYSFANVNLSLETERVFLQRNPEKYAIVFVPLTDTYQPVSSGAYSLSERYDLTVESFSEMLIHLTPDGLLVVTRWLQTPPSESLRLIATIVEALDRQGIQDPDQTIVAYRGIQTMTVLVSPGEWGPDELVAMREFTEEKRYDLVWAPDIQESDTNRFNRLNEPSYFLAVQELLAQEDRGSFYRNYPFAISPSRDDHPFFFHFFRWGQTPELFATLGRTWQPFGGSGYFILFAILALVVSLSAGLIIVPLLFLRRRNRIRGSDFGIRWAGLAYFTLIGLGFLFVEIPLIQNWILLLGQPTYAFTVVVATLLAFSSIGSRMARWRRLPKQLAFGTLVILAFLTPRVSTYLPEIILGLPFAIRAGLGALSLIPLAIMMGLPFPFGLNWLEGKASHLVPWAWAINGSASVVAAILAAILALNYGFTVVLMAGAGAYASAFAIFSVIGGKWLEKNERLG